MIDADTIFGLIIIALAVWVGWKLAQGRAATRAMARPMPPPPEHINGHCATSWAMGVTADGDRHMQVNYNPDPAARLSPELLAAYAAEAARQEMHRRGQVPGLDGLNGVIDSGAAQQRRPIDPQRHDGRY